MASQSKKRPWLAALLGTLATGLGHFYLRRWKRGLGWFAVAVGVSALVVPPEAARALLAGEGGDLVTLAPLLAVGIASVADAYVLARMAQQEPAPGPDRERSSTADVDGDEGVSTPTPGDVAVGDIVEGATDSAAECPECGKELDPDLDFCPWCTTRLGDDSGR